MVSVSGTKKSTGKKIEGKEIGIVFDYFTRVSVAAIKLTGTLKVGDKIKIIGHTTNFEQTVDSMQTRNLPIKEAKKGDEIGIKVNDKVRRHDKVLIL